MTPDRAGYPPGYGRGPPPPMQGARRAAKPPGPPHGPPPQKAPEGSSSGPQPGFQGGWGHPQGGQWSQGQYSGGPPPSNWQGNGPSRMQQPPPGYGNPAAMYPSTTTPARQTVQGRPRPPSQEMMRGGYPTGPPSAGAGGVCQPIENADMEPMYHSRGVGPGGDDDGNSSTAGTRDSKDKGRGSYKCGRVSCHVYEEFQWELEYQLLTNFVSVLCHYSAVFQKRVTFALTNPSCLDDQENPYPRCEVQRYS